MRLRSLGFGRMTHEEYRANINGLNIFFGAVLGFVISGTEAYAGWRFAYFLLLAAGMVISILYITASKHTLLYATYTGVAIAALPLLVREAMDGAVLPPRFQPTLAVWAAMTLFVELLPRDKQVLTAAEGDD